MIIVEAYDCNGAVLGVVKCKSVDEAMRIEARWSSIEYVSVVLVTINAEAQERASQGMVLLLAQAMAYELAAEMGDIRNAH